MKMLPINDKPFIRAYTHHLFINSIISNDMSVGSEIANISIMPCLDSANVFHLMEKDAKFEQTDNSFRLISDNFADKNENIVYRSCGQNDEFVVRVDYQQFARTEGVIYLFIKRESDINEDFMENYDIRFGKFCNNTLLIDDGINNMNCSTNAKTFPYWLKISVKDNVAFCSFSNDGIVWILQNETKLNYHAGESRVIGICFDLQCNNYYDWLYGTHTQLMLDLDGPTHLDFLFAPFKNFSQFTYNPFINFITNRRETIEMHSIYINILDYMKSTINSNKYVEFVLDEYYVPSRIAYKNWHYYHANLVYGYDSKDVYLLGVLNGKPCNSKISHEDFMNAYNSCKDYMDLIYEFDLVKSDYTFNAECFKQDIQNYLDGKVGNTQIYMSLLESKKSYNVFFGINIYDVLAESGLELVKRDQRISYVLMEHKRCMYERLHFLLKRKYLTDSDYNLICITASNVYKLSQILLGKIMKNGIKPNETIDNQIREYLYKMKKFDIEYCQMLCRCLATTKL